MKPLCLTALMLLAACAGQHNLLLGRVEAKVGGHQVVVTDCYRIHAPEPQQVQATEWRYTPCRDADVRIKEEELTVNGQSYGRLRPADAVLVDHGVVSVQRN